jgi:hypothetical protein
MTAINLAGIGTYLRMVGFVVPLALILILGIGDLLLLISLIDIFPEDIRSFIPFGTEEA